MLPPTPLPWIDAPDADIPAYVARTRPRRAYDLAAKLDAWRTNGIVTFENVIPHAKIDALLADITHFRDHYADYQIPIEIRGQQLESHEAESFQLNDPGVKINHLHCFSRAAARLALTAEVTDFLSHVFAEPAAVLQSLTFWRGSEQPVHIDYPYVCQQKRLGFLAASWIPLEDVHPHAGPLGYYPGGHKFDKSGVFDWGDGAVTCDLATAKRTPMDFAHYLEAQMQAAGLSRVDYCPKKGDVLIWHANLPHEGTKMIDPSLTRKSLVTHYTALQDFPVWSKQKLARLRGAGVFENGGYAFEYPWLAKRRKLPSWGR
ncbi:MAG TPA: phytanoyl-CoA dioxygenase family protein [Terricaulis sp.]|nr:phytanoyl-CoA dioxygenase family protein [Terricaulis sp.]